MNSKKWRPKYFFCHSFEPGVELATPLKDIRVIAEGKMDYGGYGGYQVDGIELAMEKEELSQAGISLNSTSNDIDFLSSHGMRPNDTNSAGIGGNQTYLNQLYLGGGGEAPNQHVQHGNTPAVNAFSANAEMMSQGLGKAGDDSRPGDSKASSQKTDNTGSNPATEEELYQKRKAQNRAAQRAFRERKEGKLKELSGKLQDAELAREKLERQLHELQQKNTRLNIENQILQRRQISDARSSTVDDSDLNNDSQRRGYGKMEKVLAFKFPNTTKCDFIEGIIDWAHHGQKNKSVAEAGKIGESYEYENEKVLTISAVWDYLVEFTELNEDYSLDIPGIIGELRGKEICHGFGPAYPLHLVNEIIVKHLQEENV